jgi:uncharacterized protein YaiI (UPF0178 family)
VSERPVKPNAARAAGGGIRCGTGLRRKKLVFPTLHTWSNKGVVSDGALRAASAGTSPSRQGTSDMQVWVDADACPGEIKELLFRAAQRTGTKVTLVANQPLRTPRSEFIDSLLVPGGMNVADRRIVELVRPGDLVITADIPLAAEVVAKGGQALDPRGELYTEANVGERLAVRNLFDELRGGGQITGGPANFNVKDRQAFANQLDRWLTAARG